MNSYNLIVILIHNSLFTSLHNNYAVEKHLYRLHIYRLSLVTHNLTSSFVCIMSSLIYQYRNKDICLMLHFVVRVTFAFINNLVNSSNKDNVLLL